MSETNMNVAGVENNSTTENTNQENTNSVDTITMSKVDFDKAIQSAEDKVRTKAAKDIKSLQDEVAKYKPVEKTESEIELEKIRLEYETKQKEVESKEKKLNIQTALQGKNIDASIADYLKDDTDVEAFSKLFESIMNVKILTSGHVPSNHQANVGITREDWTKLSVDEKIKIRENNPDLAAELMKYKFN